MATYEYRCRACDHRFEAVQSMKEAAITICPQCGKPEVERLISAGGGVLFKGSGFYITDYRKESYKSDAKKDAKPEPKIDSGDSGTSKGADSKKDAGDSGKSRGIDSKKDAGDSGKSKPADSGPRAATE